MPAPSRVVFGGTFDPPHLGHLAVVAGLRRQLQLPVLVIPNGSPPHRGSPAVAGQQRLRLLEVAIAALQDPLVSVSDIEVRRAGPSYTADTLDALAADAPGTQLLLALGSDAAAGLPGWVRPMAVLERARLVVFDRLGADARAASVIAGLRLAGLNPEGAQTVAIEAPEMEASEIRERLAAGHDCSQYLPSAVLSEIQRDGLYGWVRGRPRTDSGIIAGA